MFYLKKTWFWILGLLIGTAYASTFLGGQFPSTIINGQTIIFSYCDDKTNEDLIICTPSKDFEVAVPEGIGGRGSGTPQGFIRFSVTNNSVAQNVKVVITTGGKTMVSGLTENTGDRTF